MTGTTVTLGYLRLTSMQAKIYVLTRELTHIHSVMCKCHPLKFEEALYQQLGTIDWRSRIT